MDFTSPVSKFMTTKVRTVSPYDPITLVQELFDKHNFHHIPVVKDRTLVGMISKLDYIRFTQANHPNACEVLVKDSCSPGLKAVDVMTKHLATLESSDRINVAIDIFAENLFHALPVVDNGELVGILTTLDIINVLVEEDRIRMQLS